MSHDDFAMFCLHECKSQNCVSFIYSLDTTTQTNTYAYITQLQKMYYYNVFLFDCALHYNDVELCEGLKKMEEKKGTLMASFMAPQKRTLDYNLVFIENIDTFDDAKNLFTFIGAVLSKNEKPTGTCKGKQTHYFCIINNILQDPMINDLYINDAIFGKSSSFFKYFSNYKHFQSYKPYMFPLNKIKLNKAKLMKLLSAICFISTSNGERNDLEKQKYIHYSDYKDALVEFYKNKTYEFDRLLSINHPENIPMIVYENIHVLFKSVKDPTHQEEIYTTVRELCINYYKHKDTPDYDLFKTNNLKYFLFKTKRLMEHHKVSLFSSCYSNIIGELSFTKYYSNRAAEIQCHKRFYNAWESEG